jgi:hypothetical protein
MREVKSNVVNRVVDPHRFNADLDPAFFLTVDPDPISSQDFDHQKFKKFTAGNFNYIFLIKTCH